MGELFEQSYEQMAAGAFDAAVASVDKGFEPHQVDAAFVATQRGTLWGQEGIGGNTIPSAIGLNGIPCTRIENACPSGSDAFRVGAMAVASGVHDVALVIGVEKMRDKSGDEGLLARAAGRSEEHTSELQSHVNLVCRLLLEKKKSRSGRPRSRRMTSGRSSRARVRAVSASRASAGRRPRRRTSSAARSAGEASSSTIRATLV